MTTSGAMPTAKRVSQSALWSLKEALAAIYWYKSDLESFLRATVSPPEILTRLSFSEPKRGVVGELVDRLAADQDRYLGDLLELMREVTAFEDFAHLARLEDGAVKVARGREAVADLRKHYEGHAAVVAEREAAAERRRQAREGGARLQADRHKLDELRAAAAELLTLDEQRRGYELEKLLRELFELFDLDPKASFKIAGEQHQAAVLRYPFLTLGQAAFFLQVPLATARWMYDHDQLAKAFRLDGGIFEPVPGKVLIPYEEFEPLVSGSAEAMLALWQGGVVDVPKPESSTSPARALADVVYKDNGRDER